MAGSLTCRQFLIGLLLACALHAATGAVAGEVPDLYDARIPVSGQGEAERRDAAHAALIEVLIKVTGNRQVAAMPALATALDQPLSLVQQYRYRPLTDAEPAPPPAPSRPPYTQLLWLTFDSKEVNRLLQQAGVPIWGRMRPTTLLWVAVEEPNGRYVLGGDGHPELQALIKRAAQRRGTPVLLPLLDLEDRARVRFSDIWGNFQDTLLAASARYQPGAVLVGRLLRAADGSWSGRWSLYQNGQAEHWNAAGAQAEVLASGLDSGADLLAARYAQVLDAEAAQTLDLEVTDVADLDDYARVLRYLQSLDPVAGVQVAGVSGRSMRVRITVRGARDSLAQTIGFGNTLVAAPIALSALPPESASASASTAALQPASLTYRLLP